MKKTDPIKVEEFIRVDHAGERGAIKIYEGQLLALNTLIKDENLKKTIEAMKVHEKEHCDYFEDEIKKIKSKKIINRYETMRKNTLSYLIQHEKEITLKLSR